DRNLPFPYTDIPADAWYRPFVGVAAQKGIFKDYKQPLLLHPDSRVTHEQAVATISEILKGIEHIQQHPPAELKQTLKAPDRSEPLQPAPVIIAEDHFAFSPDVVKESMLRLFANRSDTLDDVRLLILQRVNKERRSAGMHILRHNTLLAKAAQDYGKDMSKRGFFSHFSPEGLSYVDRIRNAGYLDSSTKTCPCTPSLNTTDLLQNRREVGENYILMKSGDQCECALRFSLGENIAKGQLTPTQVMDDWMKSENHRRNILNGAFDEIGIGIFSDVWVQEFGKLDTQ
ncbi:MAG: SCP-like extracellular, partial [Candidatus Peregrinibacteria bacterium Greene1014_49]